MLSIPGIDSITGDAAEGAAAGSALPGLGTIVGGIAGAASGLIGMVGAQNQNTANQEAQVQAEQFDDYMSSTAYQRATADMRAAGINPMLAYMQGGASSPTAPTYTATNTLSDFSNSAESAGDLVKKYQDAQGEQSDNQIRAVNANAAQPLASASIEKNRADAERSRASANVATATQENEIRTSSAQTAKAENDAKTSKVESDWASTHHWMKAIGDGVATARDGTEIFGIGKFLKGLKNSSPGNYLKDMGDGTWMNKNTGEIINQK